jgi:hypothetical protein
MCDARPPATAAGALAAVRAGLDFLAAADPAALTPAEQADCIRGLAACESVHLAATTRVLAAFSAAGGYAADGQATVRSWLRWQTRATSAAAGATAKWMRRLQAHPGIAAGLAAGQVAPSVAREILDWTDKLPDEHHRGADQVLLDAASSGAELADLAALAEEIFRRCARPDADDGDDSFARRRLRLTGHYQGHAHLDADLTPSAAAALKAVLDALGRKTGPEDDRTQTQRDHDALEEGCRRAITGGLPSRAGQPTAIQLHMTLSQLLGLPEADPAGAAWITASAAPAPPGADCDAAITPIVTGTPDHDLLRQLAARANPSPAAGPGSATPASPGADGSGADGSGADGGTAGMAGRAARQLLVADAAALLSGPRGLAAWLRTTRLTGPAATPSLPLDLGKPTDTVPAWLRKAVIARDQHCGFPGCQVPAEYCHVHHIIPRADGGPTSLENCLLGCAFHHLTVVHRWGWQLTLNPDGTKTAVHPRGWRTLHSHAPPTAA